MKIKEKQSSYSAVMAMEREKHRYPKRQSAAARMILKLASAPEMRATGFSFTQEGMEKLGRDEPCLILMNHSSFTDLQITSTLFSDRQYHIVCTNDGFVGKNALMRWIGCIPTRKFEADPLLVKDLRCALVELGSSVIMFPEASYSFDGSETPLPESLGKLIRMLNVSVVTVRARGSFLRDPLYNNLQKRNVSVSAHVKYLLSPGDTKEKSAQEINGILAGEFRYDHFREQHELGIRITEPFRADGLHRVLYKGPVCGCEGRMLGEGTVIRCLECGGAWELGEDGVLKDSPYPYVTDWYRWERQQVRSEILRGTYRMEADVDIRILRDMKAVYLVGEGRLVHDCSGFHLTGCGGELEYSQSPKASYSLYADYFWYEIGDMISIGDHKAQYYCFPKDQSSAIVAKARLACEEMYSISRGRKGEIR